MARLCERPGCSQPAENAYGIDVQRLSVWIEVLDVGSEAGPGVLCRHHADALSVPLRWTLDDRREAVPRLFRSLPAVERPARERVPRTPLPQPSASLAASDMPVGVQLELRDAMPSSILGTRVTRPAPDPAAEEAPWRPLFDLDDDLDGLLVARGPLLSRAFHARPRIGTN